MATANVVQTSISGGRSNALAIQGDGAFLPKLDTTSRLALTLGTPDKGLMVYDTTLTTICVWSGIAWEFINDNSNGILSVKDFGAKGDGVTDDTAAFNAAIAYANALVSPKLTINNGTYLVSSTIQFDLPNFSSIEFIGSILTASGSPAVRIGSATLNKTGYYITGLKVSRSAIDTSGGTTGVEIRNVYGSYIDIVSVRNFNYGVKCYSDVGNGGVSYNEIHLGKIEDNRYNLYLLSTGVGYVNENVFVGGSYNHTTSYPAVSTVNIWIDFVAYRNNNNRFLCPSIEDNSVLATAAIINGDFNLIFHPRLERSVNQSTYEIQFTAQSDDCEIIGSGFVIYPTNINDLSGTASYEGKENKVINKGTPSGSGLLKLRSYASSNARLLELLDSGGIVRGYITGTGFLKLSDTGYFENGIRFRTSSGSFNDRGMFVGSGSPEGVVTANPGSLYCNTAGGANTTLYVKESGGGNTGWVGK